MLFPIERQLAYKVVFRFHLQAIVGIDEEWVDYVVMINSANLGTFRIDKTIGEHDHCNDHQESNLLLD